MMGFMFFWNPLSFYFYYSNNDLYHSKPLKLLVYLLPILTCFIIILIKKKIIISEKKLNCIFGISFIGILFGLLTSINVTIGFINQHNNVSVKHYSQNKKGIIFEPNTVAHYQTVEFNYNAKINSLGLRNNEFSTVKKDSVFRVLCIGDSWTFGWGVNIENSWPMQLENYLHSEGYFKIEVINCGSPGQYTSTHKKYMSELVPLLKPDLVLLGVLQLDDLAQIYENNYFLRQNESTATVNEPNIFSTIKYFSTEVIKASFNNYATLFFKKKETNSTDEIDIKNEWKESSCDLIQQFNYLQKLRFSTFSDTVQNLFKSGNLNASLLDVYINYPDRLSVFNNPANPATIFALQEMDKDVKEMKEICKISNAKMVFINLPINDFVGHKVERTALDVLSPFWISNNKIDSMYHSISSNNQIPYLQLTESFLNLKENDAYFFKYDGHPNEKGYKKISIDVGNYLIDNILK